MSKFEVTYNQQLNYEERVEINVRLNKRPSQKEYQTILDAIETLNTIAQKYVIIPKDNEIKEKK